MKNFTKVYSLLILFMALQSCSSDEEVTPQVQWEKIEFPGHVVIHSMYGSLEDGFLLGTDISVLKVTANGTSSKEVLRTEYAIYNLFSGDNGIYAVTISKDYFSGDGGETWQESTKSFDTFPITQLYDQKRTIYHHVSLNNGPLGTPSLIIRSTDNGTNWEDIFPYKKAVTSMHLDSKDRLYLGVSGAEWNGLSFIQNNAPAVLYFMKR